MLIITISVLSFIGFSVLGYLVYSYRNKAIDCSIKYNATKDFAEIAAKQILALETIKAQMSQTIIAMNKDANTIATSLIDEQESVSSASLEPNKSDSNTPSRRRRPTL